MSASIDNNKPVRSSTKRPRAPIACFRCHHKKVRCDGARPNCTRCLSTGVLCAYPSARKSRTTQPTNIDPFIDNLSQLEFRIRQIEVDLESQKAMVQSLLSNQDRDMASTHMVKSESQVQDTKMILAQLRLHGEQRIKCTAEKSAKPKPNAEMDSYSLSMSMYSQNMLMNDWSLLDHAVYPNGLFSYDDMSPTSTHSSSLASNISLQPSNSTNSVNSNNTALSSACSSNEPLFTNFTMEDIIPTEMNHDMLCHQQSTTPVWYNF